MLSRVCVFLPFLASAGLLPAQSSPRHAALTEVIRLDATAEDFPTVSRLLVNARGLLAIPISQDRNVRLYDPTGRRIATVGRRGGGPGEFQAMSVGGFLQDTLWIADAAQRRTVYIAANGKVLRTTPYPVPTRTTTGQVVERFSPNAVHLDGSMTGTGFFPGPGGRGLSRAVIRLSSGGPARVLAVTKPHHEDPRWYMEIGGFGNFVPFTSPPQIVYSSDGERFAHAWGVTTSPSGGTYTITVFRANGDTLFSRNYPFRSAPIPQRVRDSAAATFLPKPGTPTEGPADLPRRFQAMALQKMPPAYPGINGLTLGLDNTVWVQLHRRALSDSQTVVVLNDRGDPIATVTVPPGSRLVQASAARAWMLNTDADGLTSVVIYSVRGVTCGANGC
jgi:hypothetical protein